MKSLRLLRLLLAALFLLPLGAAVADEPDPGQVEISVGQLLMQGHYSRKKLDDSVSRQLLKNFLEGLDYNRLFFTQKDVDFFNGRYGSTLDDDILLGSTEAAYKIYDTYRKRVEDRIGKVKDYLKAPMDFTSERTVEINRSKSPWPKDETAADKLWQDRVEGELLQEQLAKPKKVAAAKPPGATPPNDQVVPNLKDATAYDDQSAKPKSDLESKLPNPM